MWGSACVQGGPCVPVVSHVHRGKGWYVRGPLYMWTLVWGKSVCKAGDPYVPAEFPVWEWLWMCLWGPMYMAGRFCGRLRSGRTGVSVGRSPVCVAALYVCP